MFSLFALSNMSVCPQAKDSTDSCKIKVMSNRHFYFMPAKGFYDCIKPKTIKNRYVYIN